MSTFLIHGCTLSAMQCINRNGLKDGGERKVQRCVRAEQQALCSPLTGTKTWPQRHDRHENRRCRSLRMSSPSQHRSSLRGESHIHSALTTAVNGVGCGPCVVHTQCVLCAWVHVCVCMFLSDEVVTSRTSLQVLA